MKTAEDVWNEVEAYARDLIRHATSRIHDDETWLDVRQKAKKEEGERLLKWAQTSRKT